MAARTMHRTRRLAGYGMVALLAALATPGAFAGPRGHGRETVMLFVGGYPAIATQGAQGYLGVDLHDVADDRVSLLKLKDTHGAEITLVDHDGPAGKAGLREHDVVVEMNGQPIANEDQMRHMLRDQAPGKTIMLTICRDGVRMAITAQMGNREQVERQAWEQRTTVPEPVYPLATIDNAVDTSGAPQAPASTSPPMRGGNSFMGRLTMGPSPTGVVLMKMSPQIASSFGVQGSGGMLVWSVATNSPAAVAGIHAGDVVVRADAKTVASTSDWTKTISAAKGRPVSVVVLRDKREVTLILVPDSKKRSELEWPTIGEEPAPLF